MLRFLFLGDIIGEPGRKAVIDMVPKLRQAWGIDFVIANGENAAAGRGITGKITIDLLRAGIAVVTTGDHIWDQKEVNAYIETEPRLLRPINYPPGTPGKGSIVLETAKGKVAVINVQGRTFMQPSLENPFLQVEQEVSRMERFRSSLERTRMFRLQTNRFSLEEPHLFVMPECAARRNRFWEGKSSRSFGVS
jgi:calcineurin-like phosphoesterase